jgi:hypothetical protein
MFISRKMQFCQDVSFPQPDLWIQHNLNQSHRQLFYGYQQADSIVYMEREKIARNEKHISS